MGLQYRDLDDHRYNDKMVAQILYKNDETK